MKNTKKRTYYSEARESQAAQTRLQILEAAKKLFQKEGFDKVTISKIAKVAQVSVPSVYAIFKSKRGMIQALIDSSLPKEQFTEIVDEGLKEKSAIKRFALNAKLARKIYDAERGLMDFLRGASVLSPELKELEQERERRRYNRQEEYVKWFLNEDILQSGITLPRARDIIWALTGRDMYRLLVIERGWTSDQYEKWLGDTLVKSLLK